MQIVLFTHSLISDWNHGNAHFLRGVASELISRGHDVRVYEPRNAWSVENLVSEYGEAPIRDFQAAYPQLSSVRYDMTTLDLNEVLAGADFVIVHEWNDHDLVKRIGRHRAEHGRYRLLFHDTHHRSVTERSAMAAYDLTHYDGVLAFGNLIRDLYLREGWARRAWTWHEAADLRVFHPVPDSQSGAGKEGDLVWIGNWGDDERTAELHEFLLGPVKTLGLKAKVYGVRYPAHALKALADAGIEYAGWLPNYRAPEVFSRYRVTVHVPRRPYVEALPGIPTIRVFEALACGIPLVCAPWNDAEHLFTPGEDFWVAKDGAEMTRKLKALIENPDQAAQLAAHGRRKIEARHTCAHRVDELLAIYRELTEQGKVTAGRNGVNVASAPAVTNAATDTIQKSSATSRPSPSGWRGEKLNIAFFGSSLVSSYWNGAATYYRGIIRALSERGHRITFYEPDAYQRQQNRDIADPDWARVVVYPSEGEEGVLRALDEARGADVLIKASGVGVFDELLEARIPEIKRPGATSVFWDVDAPATLDRMENDAHDQLRMRIPQYDLVLTYGGGDPVVNAYLKRGARACVPIYNALDPSTHFPTAPDPRFEAALGFLGNRLPDREARVEEFFLRAAAACPEHRFLLGGSGWGDKPMTANVRYIGHVSTNDHNAFNCTPMAVLNISRESMARYGFSPATRVFEAAGAGACLITDDWEGLAMFLEPGREALVARNGAEVAEIVRSLSPAKAREIGQAALRRVLAEHTYAHRVATVEALLGIRQPVHREHQSVGGAA